MGKIFALIWLAGCGTVGGVHGSSGGAGSVSGSSGGSAAADIAVAILADPAHTRCGDQTGVTCPNDYLCITDPDTHGEIAAGVCAKSCASNGDCDTNYICFIEPPASRGRCAAFCGSRVCPAVCTVNGCPSCTQPPACASGYSCSAGDNPMCERSCTAGSATGDSGACPATYSCNDTVCSSG